MWDLVTHPEASQFKINACSVHVSAKSRTMGWFCDAVIHICFGFQLYHSAHSFLFKQVRNDNFSSVSEVAIIKSSYYYLMVKVT